MDIGRKMLRANLAFATFAERMNEIGRIYSPLSGKTIDNTVHIVPPDDGKDIQSASDEWLNCCLKDYSERSRAFKNRYTSVKLYVLKLCLATLVFVLVLWLIWPIWDFFKLFFTISSSDPLEQYYTDLNVTSSSSLTQIKKAYREAMRQWHPDNNPRCGDLCKERAIRIQNAYNVLLSRGDQRFVVTEIESNRVKEIRSFFLFRMYQMVSASGTQLYNVCCGLLGPNLDRANARVVLYVCFLFTFFFFTSYEIAHFGINLIMIIQCVLHGVSMLKPNAEKIVVDKARKASYIDCMSETFIAVSAIALFYLGKTIYSSNQNVAANYVEMMLASLYVLAFLYRFTPNIRDNIVMRKCSLSYAYVPDLKSPFTLRSVIFTEVGFLFDDLFIYTTGLSFFPRAVVYVFHFIYLFQLFSLPKDLPISFRRQKKLQMKSEKVYEKHSAAPSTVQASAHRSSENNSKVGGDVSRSNFDRLTSERSFEMPDARPLSSDEINLFTSLDKEAVAWLEVPYIKYGKLDLNIGQPPPQTTSSKNIDGIMTILVASDFQRLAICSMTKDQSGRLAVNKLICSIHDPAMCQLVALDGGPGALVEIQKGNKLAVLPPDFYWKILGPDASKLTNSEKWRSVNIHNYRVFSFRQCIAFLSLLVFFLVVFAFISPSNLNVLKSTKDLPSALRPLVHGRFLSYIPVNHILNSASAGLLIVKGKILLVPDFWDAVRATQRILQ